MQKRIGNRHAWAMYAAAAVACASGVLAKAASREPAIVPTVHPTLSPTTAIQVPMRLGADQTSVWQSNLEQRMLLSGRVSVSIGYRLLKADVAAVWLTPSRESGEGVYDVAIYLSGNVEVREGSSQAATRTIGRELLVTTRIAQDVILSGVPVSKAEEDSPVVKRGAELRNQVKNRPLLQSFLPRIITITPEEDALQAGWIAKGPNNKIIAGPGEIQIVRDAQGNIIQGPAATKPKPPRPALFVTGDEERTREIGNEFVHILPNAYVFFDARDGKPPLEFRADNVVVFTVNDLAAKTQPASQPATLPAPATAASRPAPVTATAESGPPGGFTRLPPVGEAPAPSAPAPAPATAATRPAGPRNLAETVTGIYFEGNVTLSDGDLLSVRAERIYYDFASNRAIMLDATLSTVDQVRDVPLYMRAGEVRQLARGEYAAKKVTFSTSEFHTPHYAIGASEVYLHDITPNLEAPQGGGSGGAAGLAQGLTGEGGSSFEARTFQFEAKDATIQAQGVPIFYWPYLAGDTGKNEIPLRTIRVSNSKTYGLSLLTDWDLFGLTGQPEPPGVHADLNLDYFGKRGPAGGVQSSWVFDDDHGILRTYGLFDNGTDRLGADRNGIVPPSDTRGRATVRDQRELGDGLTLQLEASYISDPTFLEQYFQREFDADKEHETSVYLKKQGETDALTFLGKFNLMDFTATADQEDNQFTTEKKPELKYWRIGDSFADMFTYYSESSASNLHTDITDFTPQALGLTPSFLGLPSKVVPPNVTFRDYYKSQGYNTGDVLRGDTRQEIDMPLQVGDAKVTPYISGRFTAWNNSFPDNGDGGDTTRLWGTAGVRSSMQFWHVYDAAQSRFFDVNRIRHIIEPQFIVFASGSNQDRSNLQLFDRDVEGITKASGTQLSLNQTWQTKRRLDNGAGQPQWRDVDWITLNVSWNEFWNRDRSSFLYPWDPLRGYLFASRPDLSLVQNSINTDATWRVGEHMRLLGNADFSLDSHRFEQAAAGLAVDQSPSLTYFLGNRYVNVLGTDEWTAAMDYQLTQKYRLITSESYDFDQGRNILSSVTILRKFPRLNTALTITYDANNADTSFSFTAWPEGYPNTGFGNVVGGAADRR